jgi:2-polyprenyl-3-methyl-5-hydroxy-6-metoxy-1,4-benzoquinol methylase
MSFITKNLGQFSYFHKQLGRPRWRGKKVLDFGGNIGNLLADPASRIDPDKYWCIDVSRKAIRRGQRNHPAAHFIFYDRYNFEYNPEGIEGLEVPDTGQRFDYILALSVFTHTSRAEMIEIASHLETLLARGGSLAFTFLDPHYAPPNSGLSNLEYYLRQRLPLASSAKLNHMVDEAGEANWCTLANGSLEVEGEWRRNGHRCKQREYLVFYTPEYFRAIFPAGEILAPVGPFIRQHCCIIRNGTR